MTANDDLGRRLADHYVAEAPPRAPDWVLELALANIETAPQRRLPFGLAAWLPVGRAFVNVAIAATIVIAVAAIGVAVAGPGRDQVGGPQPSPSPSPSPSSGPSPSAPPALDQTFTSTMHGISISYPTGWTARAATEPWTTSEVVQQDSDFADVICSLGGEQTVIENCDESRVNVFFAVASQPLDGRAGDAWIAQYLAIDPACAPAEPITIDGVEGSISTDCIGGQVALVAAGGRGYVIWLYEADIGWWFRDILATVKLNPTDAIDAAPSASP